ncbi:hypothetical protein NMY22_g9113 [Coprinellus aureogranulatus]|nr:hypothetical protein NMY22_g9113 [Coprinellus aureogranulatus]
MPPRRPPALEICPCPQCAKLPLAARYLKAKQIQDHIRIYGLPVQPPSTPHPVPQPITGPTPPTPNPDRGPSATVPSSPAPEVQGDIEQTFEDFMFEPSHNVLPAGPGYEEQPVPAIQQGLQAERDGERRDEERGENGQRVDGDNNGGPQPPQPRATVQRILDTTSRSEMLDIGEYDEEEEVSN